MNFVAQFDYSLAVFLLGTFAAAFVTGVAGFAFGMVAAGVWLYALTPSQTATLIVACALLVQGHATWKLRRTINIPRLLPFVVGSAAGIPIGLAILEWVPALQLRTGIGVLLILFGVYNLARPKMPDMKRAGRAGDASVGLLNGVLGGSTGLGGILPTLWCVLRGWPRDEHRAVSQPTAAATFLMSILTFGGAGSVTPGYGATLSDRSARSRRGDAPWLGLLWRAQRDIVPQGRSFSAPDFRLHAARDRAIWFVGIISPGQQGMGAPRPVPYRVRPRPSESSDRRHRTCF